MVRGRKIFDRFTDLNVSHQRKSQLRNAERGLCAKCGRPAYNLTGFCEYHCKYRLEYNFKQRGIRIRIYNSKYRNSGDSVKTYKTLKERILNEMVI